jgi:hypothetical protein
MAELGDVMLSVIVIMNAPTAVGSSALLACDSYLMLSSARTADIKRYRVEARDTTGVKPRK